MEEEKVYEFKILCLNCRNRVVFNIPFGTYANEFLVSKKAKCNVCGCPLITS